jgi:hypothetical protein
MVDLASRALMCVLEDTGVLKSTDAPEIRRISPVLVSELPENSFLQDEGKKR